MIMDTEKLQGARWALYSFLIIFLFIFILIFRWPLLPNFLDIYYHLQVASGFSRAGGFVTQDFMQYAPVGRQHLYPPLFHFIILGLMKLGLTPLFIARLSDIIAFPALLAAMWFFMRLFFCGRTAFFSVLLGSSVYSFCLAAANFIPVTLAVILGLFSIIAQEKDRIIASAILLGLAFYAHAQAPWIFVLTFLIYGLLRRDSLKRCLAAVILGLIFALPIILYLFQNRAFYTGYLVQENFTVELSLVIPALLILAIPAVFKEGKRSFLLGALALAIIPFIPVYPYRYLSGQGLVGFILLAAVGLDNAYGATQKFGQRRGCRKMESLLLLALIVFLMFCSPSLMLRQGRYGRPTIFNSTYLNLISPYQDKLRTNSFSVVSSKFMPELITIIKENSDKDDIIFSNIEFIDTVLASLSGRAACRGMLKEAQPFNPADPFMSSSLVIWFKYYNSGLDSRFYKLVAQKRLVKIKETEIACIYRNTYPQAKIKIARPAVSSRTVIAIALLAIAVLILDIFYAVLQTK